jgi:hypothetical protein
VWQTSSKRAQLSLDVDERCKHGMLFGLYHKAKARGCGRSITFMSAGVVNIHKSLPLRFYSHPRDSPGAGRILQSRAALSQIASLGNAAGQLHIQSMPGERHTLAWCNPVFAQ